MAKYHEERALTGQAPAIGGTLVDGYDIEGVLCAGFTSCEDVTATEPQA